MALVLNEAPLTKATQAYVVKNPNQVTNAFTVNDESVAAATLKLIDKEKIDDLKSFVKGFDMTSISSDDLKKVGRALYKNDIIDFESYGLFMSGNLTTDEKGYRINTDVKFNAIALFSERLEEYTTFLKDYPVHVNTFTRGVQKGMITANHALAALAHFSVSARNDFFISERA